MLENPGRPINMGLRKIIANKGAISHIGELAKCYGKRVLIIGGITALSKSRIYLKESLDKENVTYSIKESTGFCSKTHINALIVEAETFNADLLIAVGGGSIIDTIKAVGYYMKLPVITVPTVAATCAAWAPLSVMYTDEHFPDGGLDTYAPEYVICDYTILKTNPKRYFAAGIGDSLAKWPELGVALKPNPCYASGVSLAAHVYRECLDLADQFSMCKEVPILDMELLGGIVDQVIILTGLTSELTAGAMGASDYPLIAHGVDNGLLCYNQKAHEFLHGERVSFGLLPHLLINNAPKERVREVMRFLLKLHLPTKLEDFGLNKNDILPLSKKVYEAPGISSTGVKVENIERAFLEMRELQWEDVDVS